MLYFTNVLFVLIELGVARRLQVNKLRLLSGPRNRGSIYWESCRFFVIPSNNVNMMWWNAWACWLMLYSTNVPLSVKIWELQGGSKQCICLTKFLQVFLFWHAIFAQKMNARQLTRTFEKSTRIVSCEEKKTRVNWHIRNWNDMCYWATWVL